jgi:hypothetical protein
MTIDLRYGDTIEQMKLIPNKSIDCNYVVICLTGRLLQNGMNDNSYLSHFGSNTKGLIKKIMVLLLYLLHNHLQQRCFQAMSNPKLFRY